MKLHIMTPLCFFCAVLIPLFFCDHPVILAVTALFLAGILFIYGEHQKLRLAVLISLPMTAAFVIFQLLFNENGMTVLFTVWNKVITLESLFYAVCMGIKLFGVLCAFWVAASLLNADQAVSYFSTKMPKSTLLFLLIFKLVPNFQSHFQKLKETFYMRGLAFENTGLKEKLKNYITILSVLLDQSMDSSLEIGEAAYSRGFLSNTRSVYDPPKYRSVDIVLQIITCMGIAYTIFGIISGKISFYIYQQPIASSFNLYALGYLMWAILWTTALLFFLRQAKRETEVVSWDF